LHGFRSDEPGAVIHPENPHLILDGGSGLDALQPSLMAGACGRGQGELHFLISHYHWDHVIGLPFFRPMFVPGNRINFYGDSIENLRTTIERLFTSNYSPHKGAQNLAADLAYHQVLPGQEMNIAGFRVQAVENRHQGKALTYRIQYGPHMVVYSTDHQTGDQAMDAKLVELAQGADLWILDAMVVTSEQWQRQTNQGHSSPQEAVKLALAARVKAVVLFHHDPNHNDKILGHMGFEAAEIAAGTPTRVLIARDGMVIDVGSSSSITNSGASKHSAANTKPVEAR
jgi:phosphoribosyl 1,2-cyclic phosphodiesterase